MTPERAEEIAIRAIGHIAGDDTLCEVFLGASGCTLDEMRARVADREFQASALEFLTMDDDWVVAFCDAVSLGYDQPMMARAVLAGPAGMHWT